MLTNKGQMAASEFMVIVILLILCIAEGWFIVTHKGDVTVYQNGSKPKVTPVTIDPHFGGCASTRVEEMMDAKINPVGNSVKP